MDHPDVRREIPLITTDTVPSARARAALAWLELTFGPDWVSTEPSRLDSSKPYAPDGPHPLGNFIRPLARAASEPSGIATAFDGRAIFPIVEFVEQLTYVSPSEEWLEEARKKIPADPKAFSKCLAEVRVAAIFKLVGHEVRLKAAEPPRRSCDIELFQGGRRIAEVECKAQDPMSPSDRANYEILSKIAELFFDVCKTRRLPGLRMVIKADRDLLPTDLETVSTRLRDLLATQPEAATTPGTSEISVALIPLEPFSFELPVDESLPYGDSPQLQRDAVGAIGPQVLRDLAFQSAFRGKVKCNKVDTHKAVVDVVDPHCVELQLGKYPDRVNAIRRNMKKAATQFTGDVPSIMYQEWRSNAPVLISDDFDRACGLARQHIELHPSLSAVAVYRPMSSNMRRFEIIPNPKAKYPVPTGFKLAVP